MSNLSVEDIRNILAIVREENPRLFGAGNQQHQAAPARERADRLKARVFQQEVAAAAKSAGNALRLPPPRPQPEKQPTTESAAVAGVDNMSGNLSVDSLVVQILGKSSPSSNLTKELRELVAQLPVALNAERTAYQSRISDLSNQLKKLKNDDKDKEIQRLRSLNGQLAGDIKRLEQTAQASNATTKAVHTPRCRLDAALTAIAPINARSLALATTWKTKETVDTCAAKTTGITANGITKTGANMQPVVNLQPRFQNRLIPPPKDSRTDLYQATATGPVFQSAITTSATNVFHGNEKQVIHPSRMGQMDEGSVSKIQDPRLLYRTAPPPGDKMVTSQPRINGQHGNQLEAPLQTPSLNQPQLVASTVRTTLPSEMWQARFGDLFSDKTFQATQPTASTSSQEVQAGTLQDGRLEGSISATSGKKRAVSPSAEQDANKKVKVSSEDFSIPDGSERVIKPHQNSSVVGLAAKRTRSMSEEEIERLQERYVQAKRHAVMWAVWSDSDLDVARANTTSQHTALNPIDEATKSPTEEERRDSAAPTSTASIDAGKLRDRQPVCARCRFSKLDCNHQNPCKNCTESKTDCVYWTCEYGAECKSTSCWFLH